MKKTYNPETVARCDAFIYHILSNAPAGVNIKAERKGEVAHFYIMNAPAPLYDFKGWGSAVHHVMPNGDNFCANENYDNILTELRATLAEFKAAHGSERVEHVLHIGHPRRSFVAMAKDTPKPKEKKERKASGSALRIPKAQEGTRNARIAWAMWHAFTSDVLGDCYAAEGETLRDFATFTDDIRNGKILFRGDDVKKIYDFEGLRLECAPSALPSLLVKFCKSFGYGYPRPFNICPVPSMVEAVAAKIVEKAAEVAPVVAPTPAVEVVAPAPAVAPAVEVVEPAPVVAPAPAVAPAVEVKSCARQRVSVGGAVVVLLIALLRVIVAGLSVAIAALRLVERGRLGEVIAEKTKAAAVAVRSAVVGRCVAVRSAIVARVEAVRLAIVGRCVAIRAGIVSRVEAVRLAVVGRCLAVRSAIVSWWRGLCRAVVGRYMAICLAIRARVEAVRLAIVGRYLAAVGRTVRAVRLTALQLDATAQAVARTATRLESL